MLLRRSPSVWDVSAIRHWLFWSMAAKEALAGSVHFWPFLLRELQGGVKKFLAALLRRHPWEAPPPYFFTSGVDQKSPFAHVWNKKKMWFFKRRHTISNIKKTLKGWCWVLALMLKMICNFSKTFNVSWHFWEEFFWSYATLKCKIKVI